MSVSKGVRMGMSMRSWSMGSVPVTVTETGIVNANWP